MGSERSVQPVVFVGHGSPLLALEDGTWREALGAWARASRGIRAVLVISAHWETTGGFAVSSSLHPGILHDFSGFPEDLYRLDYPAPGNPALAARIGELLSSAGLEVRLDPDRGLDHGAWVPLRALFPRAELPVLQLSLPRSRNPQLLLQAGRALAPLRAEGVLILGSGGLVHNLGRLGWDGQPAPEPWALGFETWLLARIRAQDTASLASAREMAPGHALAAPTTEHLDPLYVVLGASGTAEPADLYTGWQHGNLSLRALAFG